MSDMKDPLRLEDEGWEALSSSPERAKEFYGSVLADDAQMLFPGEMRLFGKDNILSMMGSPPWDSYTISQKQLVDLTDTAKAVTYKVSAEREGAGEYRALICSTYALRGGDWKLVIHQQTPA
jgi:hypothetical protein